MQHLLARADWDADAVRDDLMGYVHDRLSDPAAVLVVDGTVFLKRGTKSCGVARQYTGTAGRIENAQVGVFLAYAGRGGHAPVDRSLYLPKEWVDDRPRCDAAGVPEDAAFATKPRLAERMLRRARAAGVAAGWVTGDAVYGSDGAFRRFLEGYRQAYLLAVPANQPLFDGENRSTVKAIAEALPAAAWGRAGAGAGSKGPREYGWAVRAFGAVGGHGWRLWLVVRRHPLCVSPEAARATFPSTATGRNRPQPGRPTRVGYPPPKARGNRSRSRAASTRLEVPWLGMPWGAARNRLGHVSRA